MEGRDGREAEVGGERWGEGQKWRGEERGKYKRERGRKGERVGRKGVVREGRGLRGREGR